jgi:hypothetical protein
MIRAAVLGLLTATVLCGPAAAHHFAIDLEAAAGAERQKASAESLAAGVTAKPRGVLHVKTGAPVTVKWMLTATDPKETYKNVLVHYFVVKEDRPGQQRVPPLTKDVVAEGALTVDFRPGDHTRGEVTFTLDNAGAYLLRVETIGSAAGTEGHEHYAALDVVAR